MNFITFVDTSGKLISVYVSEDGKGYPKAYLRLDGREVSAANLTEYSVDLTAVDYLVLREMVCMDNYFKEYNEDLFDEYKGYFEALTCADLGTMYTACANKGNQVILRGEVSFLQNLELWDDNGEPDTALEWAFHLDVPLSKFLNEVTHEGGSAWQYNGDTIQLLTEEERTPDKEDYMDDILGEMDSNLRYYFDEDRYWAEHGESYARESLAELNFMNNETIHLCEY